MSTLRNIVLDVETTGTEVKKGHRVIEIGSFELVKRQVGTRYFHHYLNAGRASDPGALSVHGITEEFLADKPKFEVIAQEFIEFIRDAQVIIHNAPFDVGFLDNELSLLGLGKMTDYCTIFDTLPMAREMFPGQRNSLDALCNRFNIDRSHRTLHGGLLDARLLGLVYLFLTSGQNTLFDASDNLTPTLSPRDHIPSYQVPSVILYATPSEINEHEIIMKKIYSNQTVGENTSENSSEAEISSE